MRPVTSRLRARPRVVFDCDGVLCDVVRPSLPIFSRIAGRPVHYQDITMFDMGKALGLTPEQCKEFYSAWAQPGFWSDLPKHDGALEAVNRIRAIRVPVQDGSGAQLGVDLRVATNPFALSPTWEAERCGWLDEYVGIGRSQVTFTSQKDMLACDFLVEDRLETLEEWCAEHAVDGAGRVLEPTGILVCQPWNRHRGIPKGCVEVDDVLSAANFIVRAIEQRWGRSAS